MDYDVERGVVLALYHGEYKWFESERELWILDWERWGQFGLDLGYDVPEASPDDRLGMLVVNEKNAGEFLEKMAVFEISKNALGRELAERFPTAGSWWDVPELFPVAFVDFDRRRVAGFYFEGTRIERYVPCGWTSEFIDFCDELPIEERYWVQNGRDLLKELNERGKDASVRYLGPK